MIITCNCKVCGGRSARLGAPVPPRKLTPTYTHNMVTMAHGPLSQAASVQAFGPWSA